MFGGALLSIKTAALLGIMSGRRALAQFPRPYRPTTGARECDGEAAAGYQASRDLAARRSRAQANLNDKAAAGLVLDSVAQ